MDINKINKENGVGIKTKNLFGGAARMKTPEQLKGELRNMADSKGIRSDVSTVFLSKRFMDFVIIKSTFPLMQFFKSL